MCAFGLSERDRPNVRTRALYVRNTNLYTRTRALRQSPICSKESPIFQKSHMFAEVHTRAAQQSPIYSQKSTATESYVNKSLSSQEEPYVRTSPHRSSATESPIYSKKSPIFVTQRHERATASCIRAKNRCHATVSNRCPPSSLFFYLWRGDNWKALYIISSFLQKSPKKNT